MSSRSLVRLFRAARTSSSPGLTTSLARRCAALAALGTLGLAACGSEVTKPSTPPSIPITAPPVTPVGAITICCAADTLLIGDVVRASARVTSADSQLLTGRHIDWVSSDRAVVSFLRLEDEAADFIVGRPGDATVTATVDGRTAAVTFRVLALPPAVAFVWSRSAGMRDLDGLPGAQSSYATGIDAAGDIVGYSELVDGTRAVIWPRGGGAIELQPPSGFRSARAMAINASGVAVGWGTLPDGRTQALRWLPGGQVQRLPSLDSGDSSRASAINAAGVVVGRSGDSPVFWSTTGASRLAAGSRLDGKADATAINDAGEVVGTASAPEFGRYGIALRWSLAGEIQEIPTTCVQHFEDECDTTFAGAVNDAGVVAGSTGVGFFVWSRATGSTVYFNPLGAPVFGTQSTGINSSGLVVGYAHTTVARIRSFLSPLGNAALPVTSPTARVAVVALGLNDEGLVVGWHR